MSLVFSSRSARRVRLLLESTMRRASSCMRSFPPSAFSSSQRTSLPVERGKLGFGQRGLDLLDQRRVRRQQNGPGLQGETMLKQIDREELTRKLAGPTAVFLRLLYAIFE